MFNQGLFPLPIGVTSFSKLREIGAIYVDKTAIVARLVQHEKVLFVRPRRFGKSLLISTLESLFKYGLKDFKGLAIEKLWTEKTYNVLRLDFSRIEDFNSVEEFSYNFNRFLSKAIEASNLDCPIQNDQDAYDAFERWLARQANNSLVILIDEYDAPLTRSMDRAALFDAIRKKLSNFYFMLKAVNAPIRFLFMTGITKFSNLNIFSAFNELTDLSLDRDFGTLLGYTHEELEHYFGNYIDRAAGVLNKTRGEVISQMAKYYDGFCFDETASYRVFAPWSTLNFFARPQKGFANYWFASGGQAGLLTQYFSKHALQDPQEYAKEHVVNLSQLALSENLETLNETVLLNQAGYYTIKKVVGSTVTLDYPNLEVSESMAKFYADCLMRLNGAPLTDAKNRTLLSVFSEDSPEVMFDAVNRALLRINYLREPLKNESDLQSFLEMLFVANDLHPICEHMNRLGRSDIEIALPNRHWVFELKYARKGEEKQKLKEAVEQIKKNRYGEQLQTDALIRVAMVYSQTERLFTDWAVVDV